MDERIKRIKDAIRRYFQFDPWTEEPNPEFDDYLTAQEVVDQIVDILR